MKNIITITSSQFNDGSIATVNARELHTFLNSKQEFANWIKNRISKYDFIEGVDFTVDKFINGRATQIDYHISLDMAKELSMVENNDRGREARRYFIECERRSKQAVTLDLENPAQLRGLLMDYSDRLVNAEEEIKELSPKADAFDRIATEAEGSLCITNAAKDLQVRPKMLFQWLQFNKWIYKRTGANNFVAYQNRIQQGVLEHKVTEVTRGDGTSKITEQVRVTAKGLAYLAKVFVKSQAAE